MNRMINVKSGKDVLTVKDCRSLLRAARGLMFDSLNHDGAMILGGNIWMPFVKKPLWLVFLDGNLSVTSIQYAIPIALDPKTWKTYSDGKAKYCLELVRRPSVAEGMRIKILP